MTPAAYRTAGRLGVLGVVLAVVANLLHPNGYHSADEYLRKVHGAADWTAVNFGIAVAGLVGAAALVGVAGSLRDGGRPDLAGYARSAAGVSAATMLVLASLEGFGAAKVADLYATGDRSAVYPVGYALFEVTLALLGLWYATFFGATVLLLALAMRGSAHYPPWVARLGLGAGAGGVLTGSLIYLAGSSFLVTTVLFLLVSVAGCAWMLAVSRVLLRLGRPVRVAVDG